MVLAHDPDGDTFGVREDKITPVDGRGVTVEFDSLLWGHHVQSSINILVDVLPVAIHEELKDPKR